MIILRYLTRELITTTVAIATVLLVVIVSGRFVRYLADAAAGKIDTDVLLTILFFRLPGFLELIVPLAFLLGILMAYGRLYAEQEMTVLSATGMSQQRLLTYTYLAGGVFALFVGLCSLWLTPMGIERTEIITEQQKQRNELDSIRTGRFQTSKKSDLVIYAENQQGALVENVFISRSGVDANDDVITLRARSGERIDHPQFNQRYLQLNDGVRYAGRPGEQDFSITEFEAYGQLLPAPSSLDLDTQDIEALPTLSLLKDKSAVAQATLQWRFSAPVLILVVTILGVTLSHTTPRRGRYAMLFPAIVIYLLYLVVLNAGRDAIVEGKLPAQFGLWGIHFIFLVLTCLLFSWRTGSLRRLLSSSEKN